MTSRLKIPLQHSMEASTTSSRKTLQACLARLLDKRRSPSRRPLHPVHAHPAVAQEKSLLWERFDVDIIIRKDSSFEVTEHQTIRFTRGAFTYGYRDIPKKNFSSLDDWTLTDSQRQQLSLCKLRQRALYIYRHQKSLPLRHLLVFPDPMAPTSSETFALGYTVRGGLRYYEGGDQLWWQGDLRRPQLPRAGRAG